MTSCPKLKRFNDKRQNINNFLPALEFSHKNKRYDEMRILLYLENIYYLHICVQCWFLENKH